MWHVSSSIQSGGRFVIDPDANEHISIALLEGVGGDIEWWNGAGTSNAAVTHLRVPTTMAEQICIPTGLVTMDAGPEGILRPRTR